MKSLFRLISWIVSLIFVTLCVLFAVNNRQDVSIDCWPLDIDIKTPLYVITLGAFLFGLVVGAVMLWASNLRTHYDKHKLSKEVDKLKSKLNEEPGKPV